MQLSAVKRIRYNATVLRITKCHHVAIICRSRPAALRFYQEILGFSIIKEEFRSARDSWKIDLLVPGTNGMQVELFTFPDPPARRTQPEACGLRHLAFAVADIDGAIIELAAAGVAAEPVRVDFSTNRRFTFVQDPDGLPIELYEEPL